MNIDKIITEIHALLKNNYHFIDALLSEIHAFTWENFIIPIEMKEYPLAEKIHLLSLLNDTLGLSHIEEAFQKLIPNIEEYQLAFLHNKKIYSAYQEILKSSRLSQPERIYIQNTLTHAKNSGIDLNQDQRNHIKNIFSSLAALEHAFNKNIENAKYFLKIQMPDLTLDHASYQNVMKYTENRDVRKRHFYHFSTIASPLQNQFNNEKIMYEILENRMQLTHLLGFNHFADFALSCNALKSTNAVLTFLFDKMEKIKDVAKREMDELRHFAKLNHIDPLEPWDILYLSHCIQKEKFHLDKTISEYRFPLKNVLSTLFQLTHTLFDINIIEQAHFETWHPDVRFFNLYDESNHLRGSFYLDLFMRNGKREGAFCADVKIRYNNPYGFQIPVACIVTSFETNKDTISHQDMITLFHEYGHCLQKILTEIDYSEMSGDKAVPFDTLEIISQWMEHWCFEPDLLAQMIQPENLKSYTPWLNQIKQIKTFHQATRHMKDILHALLDIHLHTIDVSLPANTSIQMIYNNLLQFISIFPYRYYDHFPCRFIHIFSGGFASSYYSYLYSESIADKLFAQFQKNGLFCKITGKRFLSLFISQGMFINIDSLVAEFEMTTS